MRFLENENFPDPSIEVLRGRELDVRSIRRDAPGIPDHEVIAMAKAEGRIILTFDKDYGELIFRHGLEDPPAVLFLRYRGADPTVAAALVLEVIANGTSLDGRFTVIEEEGIRQRIYAA